MWSRLAAKRSSELAVVNDPGTLRLVERFADGTDRRDDEAHQADGELGGDLKSSGRLKLLENEVDELPRRDGRRAWDMPDLSECLLPLSEGDQSGREIIDEGVGVRCIGIAESLRRLPRKRPREDDVSDL